MCGGGGYALFWANRCRSHSLDPLPPKSQNKGRQIDFIENFQYNFNVRNEKMLNMQDIGYFLYMQEMEEKEKDEALKVNVKNNTDFVGEQAPSNEERA
jgi:hypothetical protein